MKIGQVAKLGGASVRSIRHYEGAGLVRSRRTEGGYREFAPDAAELVVRIRRLISLGFSTAEIATFAANLVGEASLRVGRHFAVSQREDREVLPERLARAGRRRC